jgi:hypothetical protein
MGLPEDMGHEIGDCEPEGEVIQREVDALDDYLVAKLT